MSHSRTSKKTLRPNVNNRASRRATPRSHLGDLVRSFATADDSDDTAARLKANAQLLDEADKWARRVIVLEGFLYDLANAPIGEYDAAIEELARLVDSRFELRSEAFESVAKLNQEFEAANGESLDDAITSQWVSAAHAGFALGLTVGRLYGASVEKGAVRP